MPKLSLTKLKMNSITKRIKKHELPRMADVQKIKGLLREVADMMDKAEKDMVHLIYLAKHCKSLDSEVIDNCNLIADTFFEQIVGQKKFVDDKLVKCDATIDLLLAANAANA